MGGGGKAIKSSRSFWVLLRETLAFGLQNPTTKQSCSVSQCIQPAIPAFWKWRQEDPRVQDHLQKYIELQEASLDYMSLFAKLKETNLQTYNISFFYLLYVSTL